LTVKGVEGVKKLFARALRVCKKVNVIYQEHIALPVSTSKIVPIARLYRRYVMVNEGFAWQEGDVVLVWTLLQLKVYGLE
jgi:hypothetical protein